MSFHMTGHANKAQSANNPTRARKPKLIDPEIDDAIAKYGERISYPVAAEISGASIRTLKRLSQSGHLPCYRIGPARVLRVKTADVLALIERVA